jgi:DNA-binding MarR family transcriptional regulator
MAIARHKRGKASQPILRRGDEGGPLSRELLTVKLVRLVDFMSRAASLAFPRVSGLSDFEWRVVAWSCEIPGLSLNDLAALLHRGAAQVSRTVKKLVAAGLLDRVRRRGGPGVLIGPTALGRTVYGPLANLARQRNAGAIAGLKPREIRVLERCIATMMSNVLAQLEREQQLQARRDRARRSDRGPARARL